MTKGKRIISGTMNWGFWFQQLNTPLMEALIARFVELGILTFYHADIYGGYTTDAEFGNVFLSTKIPREDLHFISKCEIQFPSDPRKIVQLLHLFQRLYCRPSGKLPAKFKNAIFGFTTALQT